MKDRDLTAIETALKSGNPAAITAAARGDYENAMVAAMPGGIEMQEAAGQAAFVGTRDSLPVKCPRAELEKLGFKFGEPIDDLFIAVTLPAGWSKKATGHSMWSDLLDEKGRKRGSIFYKAAFYDRSAHMHLEKRYTINSQYLNADGKEHDYRSAESPANTRYVVRDNATGKAIHESAAVKYRAWDEQEAQGKATGDWLKENYPQADDPTAYWD